MTLVNDKVIIVGCGAAGALAAQALSTIGLSSVNLDILEEARRRTLNRPPLLCAEPRRAKATCGRYDNQNLEAAKAKRARRALRMR